MYNWRKILAAAVVIPLLFQGTTSMATDCASIERPINEAEVLENFTSFNYRDWLAHKLYLSEATEGHVKFLAGDGEFKDAISYKEHKIDTDTKLIQGEIEEPTQEGYAFDGWRLGDEEDKVLSTQEIKDMEFSKATVFTAVWETDALGTDSDGSVGDGIADKYQTTVTYTVKYGTFADGSKEKKEILTFRTEEGKL